MQRVPTRQRQNIPNDRQQNNRNQGGEASPTLLLARRIREEQGVEQLKSFLAAMEPFAAPNELRTICGAFGINYDSLMKQYSSRPVQNIDRGMGNGMGMQMNANYANNGMPLNAMSMPGAFAGNRGGGNQMQMLQMLMNMKGLMNGGKGDMSQLFKLMGGK